MIPHSRSSSLLVDDRSDDRLLTAAEREKLMAWYRKNPLGFVKKYL